MKLIFLSVANWCMRFYVLFQFINNAVIVYSLFLLESYVSHYSCPLQFIIERTEEWSFVCFLSIGWMFPEGVRILIIGTDILRVKNLNFFLLLRRVFSKRKNWIISLDEKRTIVDRPFKFRTISFHIHVQSSGIAEPMLRSFSVFFMEGMADSFNHDIPNSSAICHSRKTWMTSLDLFVLERNVIFERS